MTANGGCGRFISGSVRKRAHLDLEFALVDALHEMHVEVTQTAVGVGFLDPVTHDVAARDDDPISARDPQKRLGHALDEGEVLLVMARAVAIDAGLVRGGISLVTLDSDDDILPVLCGCLSHLAAYQREGGELGIELCVDLKLHIGSYLRSESCIR